MIDKEVLKFALILVIVFLTPLFLISLLSSPPLEMDAAYANIWADRMNSFINKETLEIIINNLLVTVIMCLFSIIPFVVYNSKERQYEDANKLISLINMAYILYFLKEGVRAGLGLLSFPYKSYMFGVFILTLPHGLIEIAGLAVASSATLFYLMKAVERKYAIKLLMLAVELILIAGILETTLTPFLFRQFV